MLHAVYNIHPTYVFTDKAGDSHRNYNPRSVNKAFERAGLEEFTYHDLRHYAISQLVQAGNVTKVYDSHNKLLGFCQNGVTRRVDGQWVASTESPGLLIRT